jgi:hypothetical protein
VSLYGRIKTILVMTDISSFHKNSYLKSYFKILRVIKAGFYTIHQELLYIQGLGGILA